jgi:hypothetical protein
MIVEVFVEQCFAQNMSQHIAVGFETSYYVSERMDSKGVFAAVRKDSKALMSECEDHYYEVEASKEGFGSYRSEFEILTGSEVTLPEKTERKEIFVEVLLAL